MGLHGTAEEQLGNERFEQGGRIYKKLENKNAGTIPDGAVVVYYDYDQKGFDQPSTAKLSRIAGVMHNPDADIDNTETTYDTATGEYAEVCISGPCVALVDGTVAVAAGDMFKAVNAQNYFVKDTTAQADITGTYAIAREAQPVAGEVLTKVLVVRNGS